MSCEENFPRQFAGERAPEKFRSSAVKGNWVYVSNDGPEITTIEQHIEFSPSADYRAAKRQSRQSNECPDEDPSREQWKHGAGAVAPNGDTSSAKALVHELRRVLVSLNLPADALDVIEADLSTLETARGAELRGVYEGALDFQVSNELELGTTLSETSSNAPSILEDYFDKAREVFVARERLAELDNEYDDRFRPAPEPGRDGTDINCDCEIDIEYNKRRQQLLETLALTESELYDLRELCARQGIEPELNRYRRVSNRKRPGDLVADYYETYAAGPMRGLKEALASMVTRGNETAICNEEAHSVIDQ